MLAFHRQNSQTNEKILILRFEIKNVKKVVKKPNIPKHCGSDNHRRRHFHLDNKEITILLTVNK